MHIIMDNQETDAWLESLFSDNVMMSEEAISAQDVVDDNEDEVSLLKRCASMLPLLTEPVKCYGEGGGYNFSTAKGERSLAGVAQQDVIEMDRFQADLLDMVDSMQACTVTDELATAMRDPGTRAPWVSLWDVSGVEYAVSGRMLEVSLDPNRSRTLLEPLLDIAQYEDVAGVIPLLAEMLDARCSCGTSCAYRHYFPAYTGPCGPIALNAKTCLALTVGVQLAGSNRACLRDILNTLIEVLLSRRGMDEGTRRGSDLMSDMCICCLLITQAANSFDALSEMVYEESDLTVTPRSAAFIGMTERQATITESEHDHVDLFSDILQISGNKRYSLSNDLCFAEYDLVRENDLWLVVERAPKNEPVS